MAETPTIDLARMEDADTIAFMSRDLVEHGLPWTWLPRRIARQIRRNDTEVIVARLEDVVGFAIMRFLDVEAHLLLFGVAPEHRRTGIGRELMMWLEESARTAGTFRVLLEVRTQNHGARTFYRKLGYHQDAYLRGYYQGKVASAEHGVRMVKNLAVRTAGTQYPL